MSEAKFMLIVALPVTLLFAPLAAEAQQSERVYRIGLLDYPAPDATRQEYWNAFRQQMRELDYLEGQHVSFGPCWGQGD